MSAMTSKNPLQASSSREGIPPGEPLSLVSICLDKDTWGFLKLFADSTPVVRLQKHLGDYRLDDHESVLERVGDSASDICLVEFDGDCSSAEMVSEGISA